MSEDSNPTPTEAPLQHQTKHSNAIGVAGGFTRTSSISLKDRLDVFDHEYGEDFADALANAHELLFSEGQKSEIERLRREFFLSVLFAMDLPRSGAADELIEFYQKLSKEAGDDDGPALEE
jgi:hypothetical protein